MKNTGKKIRVMLVHDHFAIRVGLARSLDSEADIAVVAECATGEQALELFRERCPDVVIMDYRLPGKSGVETTRILREEFPQARVAVLSVYEGEEDIYRAIQAGAAAYLPKSAELVELLLAIRTISAGGAYLPASVRARLEARSGRPELSPRELEALEWIVQGLGNKQIAKKMDIAERTVKLHVGKLLEKLGVADRTQAATTAVQRGIIHLD